MRNVLLVVLTLFEAALCCGAEVYPGKPVRVIATAGPGSSIDLTARVISQQLSEHLGKSFVVDNRTGAAGIVANEIVAKSIPDGYTLLMAQIGFAITPGFNKSLPYDPVKDFTPISEIVRGPFALVVIPALNVNTLKEFVALAQANPGKFNYASGGAGGIANLMGELFKSAAKVNIVHIPYKGGDSTNAVLNGQVQMTWQGIPPVLPHVKSGRVRALAVTSERRWPSMPDVPSMAEAGYSEVTVYSWHGMLGPARIPKEVVNKLQAEVARALAVPSVKERFSAVGVEVMGSSPDEFAKLVRNELRRWAEVIKSAGITGEE